MYASLAPQLEGLSDYERIKKIYEFVMEHMDYLVSGTFDDHTVVGFVNGKGVYQAYAIGLYILLDKVGFEVRYVDGPLSPKYQNGFPRHVWNMVKLDGQWYHLDVTWDDELNGNWYYFLVSDTRVNGSRGWKKEFYEPAPSIYVHP